jgi:hypothetical protein
MKPTARAQSTLLEALVHDTPLAGVAPRSAVPDLPGGGDLVLQRAGLDPGTSVPSQVTVGDDVASETTRWVRFAGSGEPDLLLLQVVGRGDVVLGAIVARFDARGAITALHGMAS